MTKPQIAIVAVVLVAAVTTAVVEFQSSEKLRAENSALQVQSAELSRLAQENARLSNSLAQASEIQLSRDQMSELMRLRAQTGQLKRDLAAANTTAKARPTIQKLGQVTTPADDDPTKPLTAEFTARVPTGQSLITGGWSTAPGVRTFVMVTPTDVTSFNSSALRASFSPATRQTHLQAMFFEVPETLLSQIGLDQFTSETRQSSVQNLLAAENAKGLVDALKTTDGINILSQPRAVTSNGNEATVSVSSAGGPNGDGPAFSKIISLTPQAAPDRSGIDLAVRATFTQSAPKAVGN